MISGYKYHGKDTNWMMLAKRYPVKSNALMELESKRGPLWWLMFALSIYGIMCLLSRLPS